MRSVKIFLSSAAVLVLVLLILGFAAYKWLNPSAAEHQLWLNGQIISLDSANNRYTALEVRNGRISWLGDTAAAKQRQAADTYVVDLQGRTLLPGFVEAHGHFPGVGLSAVLADLNAPPIADVQTLAQLQAKLAKHAEERKAGRWVLGMGYDDSLLAERRHPNRHDLDAVSTEHPIYIVHVSGHMGVANSKALNMLGITDDSPNPVGGEIRRDSNGQITGLLLEMAHKPVYKQLLQFPLFQQFSIIRKAAADYAAQGFTTVQNGLALSKHIKGLQSAKRIGLIPQRLVLWPDYEEWQAASGEQQSANVRSSSVVNDSELDVVMGAIKFQLDGSIQGYTGWLSEPYAETGDHATAWRGEPSMALGHFADAVQSVHCAERQLAIHANGDAAIEAAMDAIAKAQTACPRSDARSVIVHAQMARADQLARMLQLGASPSFFSAHTYYWGDRHRDIFMGPERAAGMSPAGTAQALGLRFTTHLDSPVVPIEWQRQFRAPVERLSAAGTAIGPSERISREQALRGMTIDAAWQLFLDHEIGSLELGKRADFVVLSANPLQQPLANLADIKVEQTVVGGLSIYAAQ